MAPAREQPIACIPVPDPSYATDGLDAHLDQTKLHVCLRAEITDDPGPRPEPSCTDVEIGAIEARHESVKTPPVGMAANAIMASHHGSASYSDDGAMLLVDNINGGAQAVVWDIATDRQIAFAPPAGPTSPLDSVSFDFVGHAVVGSWMTCGVSACARSRVFRRDGTVIADNTDSTTGLLPLDAHRIVAVRNAIEIYDVDAAKLTRRIDFMPAKFDRRYNTILESPAPDPLFELVTGEVVVTTRSETSIDVVVANPTSGAITRRVHVPICSSDV